MLSDLANVTLLFRKKGQPAMSRTAHVLLTAVIVAIAAHSLLMVSDLSAQQPIHEEITSHHQIDESGPLGGSAQAEVCPESNTFVVPRAEPSSGAAILAAPLPLLQNLAPLMRAEILSFQRPDTTCALLQVFRL